MLPSPTFRERVSADCGAPNGQFDWLAANKKWAGPLLAHRPELMLLPARVKPQSLVTVREPVPICRIHNSFLTVHGVDPVLGIRSTARSDCREETLDMGLAYDFLTLKADAV